MKKIVFLICFIIFSLAATAQKIVTPPMDGSKPFTSLREQVLNQRLGWDAGFSIGSSHSLTDIGGTRDHSRILFFDTQWKASGLKLGVFGRYRISDLFALKTELNYAQLSGADSLSPSSSSRYNRDFHFTNNIYELAFKGEFYVPKAYLDIPVDVYGYIGFGMLFHNPDLQVPNNANYQAASFSQIQPVIPLGLGFHYTLPNNFRIGYNIGWRKTFTDFLDAHSSTASRGNDSYFFNAFNFSYYFR
jgi:hypothetical protein